MVPSVKTFLATGPMLRREQVRDASVGELDELYCNLVAVYQELDPKLGGVCTKVVLHDSLREYRKRVWHAGGVIIQELERRGV